MGLVNLSFPRQTLNECSCSLASAEIEILLRIGKQTRFVRSGKIGWARLTETLDKHTETHTGYVLSCSTAKGPKRIVLKLGRLFIKLVMF